MVSTVMEILNMVVRKVDRETELQKPLKFVKFLTRYSKFSHVSKVISNVKQDLYLPISIECTQDNRAISSSSNKYCKLRRDLNPVEEAW